MNFIKDALFNLNFAAKLNDNIGCQYLQNSAVFFYHSLKEQKVKHNKKKVPCLRDFFMYISWL
ncbi:MAG TPA: hypothetical protein DEU93_03455 [Chitinophagaceae bacterium]|nr:hypothetical protein [Chitinophagaceae bacterium]